MAFMGVERDPSIQKNLCACDAAIDEKKKIKRKGGAVERKKKEKKREEKEKFDGRII